MHGNSFKPSFSDISTLRTLLHAHCPILYDSQQQECVIRLAFCSAFFSSPSLPIDRPYNISMYTHILFENDNLTFFEATSFFFNRNKIMFFLSVIFI